MEVEDVTRVGLPPGRPAQVERHLPVCPRVFGEVVVADKRLFALVAEVLAHGAAGVRRDVLQRRRLRGSRRNDRRELEGAVLVQRVGHPGDAVRVLADRDVDADEILALLVDDRVEEDRRLAGLPVAEDELALATADRNHGVDRLDPGLHRRVDALAGDHAGRDLLHGARLLGLDRALAVDGLTERVDDTAEQFRPDRHLDDPAGGLDLVAFLHVLVGAHDHGADLVVLQVQRHAVDVARELQQLARHGSLESIDGGDPVGDRDDPADLRADQLGLEVLEPRLD